MFLRLRLNTTFVAKNILFAEVFQERFAYRFARQGDNFRKKNSTSSFAGTFVLSPIVDNTGLPFLLLARCCGPAFSEGLLRTFIKV